MGYGGFFKKVVRIVVPIAVSFILPGNPLAVAIASSLTTAATGGSFKEALMSGAASYIGSSISGSLSGVADTAAINTYPTTYIQGIDTGFAGVTPFVTEVPVGGMIPAGFSGSGTELAGQIAAQGAIAGGIGDAINTTDELGSQFQQEVGTLFGGQNVGGVTTGRSAFDTFRDNANKTLGELGLGGGLSADAAAQISPLTGQVAGPSVTSGFIGGLATLSLNDALLLDTPEADEALLSLGFTPQALQLLKNEARNALSQETFERLTGPEGVANPFGEAQPGLEEFQKVIAAGIERENIALGPDITERQFRTVFDDPSLGQNILGEEESLRRQAFGREVSGVFPGDAFDPIGDDIINAILDERIEPIQRQVATAGARGDLNRYGGRTANEEISRQRGAGFENISQIGEGLQQGSQSEIDFIRDRASADVRGYQLGDELFDVAPFSQERSDLIGAREGSLRPDLSRAVGNQPIFDVQEALNVGGRAQGVVSGNVNQSFLDAIARGGGGTAAKTRRGLGQSGRGVF